MDGLDDITRPVERERTEIAKLGEFGLIEHLTAGNTLNQATTVLGPGDDAAVLHYGEDKDILLSTDLLLEGIHFDLSYVPLKHLGYKAAVVNFSDICAMNGIPSQLTVSVGISKRFSVEDMEELYSGIKIACKGYGVDLIGGDTSASLTGLSLCLTCTGEVAKGQAVLRSGAKVNDLICVSGNLGAAYMGLQLLEREKLVYEGQQDFQPDFAGKEYLLQRQLRPEARKDIVEKLAQKKIRPTAMIDVSDGLSSDLLHICKQSNCGCRIFEDKLPIDYQTASLAEEMNMNLSTAALHGGEDYELLFTVPLELHETIENWPDVRIIGYICHEQDGRKLITRDNKEFDIIAQGWKMA
jgi:thiamine-monophosphate kinase